MIKKIKFYLSLIIARCAYLGIKILNKSSGTSFVGMLVLKICPDFLKYCPKYIKKRIVTITGTNGKSTTSGIIAHILETAHQNVIHNLKGANMLTGVANVFALCVRPFIRFDYAVIESDEAYLSKLYDYINADYLVVTNLFRDQLDRYGELNTTAGFIKNAIDKIQDDTKTIVHVDTNIDAYGIKPRNEEQAMALDVLLDNDIPLVTIMGKAGTGKTLLALAAALAKRREYRQILLARPVVALSNKDLGFLPGDINSKLDPYMQPLFDNLSVIQHIHSDDSDESKNIKKMLENEKIVISPLAYIRGRSLNKIYFIVDEAQNLTPHEIKTIITRAGEGTKIVFTGDIHQIDTPYLDERNNGLTYLIDRTKGEVLSGTVTLEKGERSKLAELAANVL